MTKSLKYQEKTFFHVLILFLTFLQKENKKNVCQSYFRFYNKFIKPIKNWSKLKDLLRQWLFLRSNRVLKKF